MFPVVVSSILTHFAFGVSFFGSFGHIAIFRFPSCGANSMCMRSLFCALYVLLQYGHVISCLFGPMWYDGCFFLWCGIFLLRQLVVAVFKSAFPFCSFRVVFYDPYIFPYGVFSSCFVLAIFLVLFILVCAWSWLAFLRFSWSWSFLFFSCLSSSFSRCFLSLFCYRTYYWLASFCLFCCSCVLRWIVFSFWVFLLYLFLRDSSLLRMVVAVLLSRFDYPFRPSFPQLSTQAVRQVWLVVVLFLHFLLPLLVRFNSSIRLVGCGLFLW